jgi:hypothetical protein
MRRSIPVVCGPLFDASCALLQETLGESGYPKRGSTVPGPLALALPIVFQIVALLLLRIATALKLTRMPWPPAEATQMMLGVVYALVVTGILTNIAKLQVRRALRCP